jgi:hypothetical protein
MMGEGGGEMDEQTVPQRILEALDASAKDIAAGRVHEADAVQAEARHMLAEHEAGRASSASPRKGAKTGGRTRAIR